MPPLIISIGQGGIAPFGSFWSLNFSELKYISQQTKKSTKKQHSSTNIKSTIKSTLSPSTPPLLLHFYIDRTWSSPKWIMVDSESKVIDHFKYLIISTKMKKEGGESA